MRYGSPKVTIRSFNIVTNDGEQPEPEFSSEGLPDFTPLTFCGVTMFGFQKKQEFQRLRSVKAQKTTRRADAVLAPVAELGGSESLHTKQFNQHAVFYALAAGKSTCCIRISNTAQKSRALLILF